MTDDLIERLRELRRQATPGPWEIGYLKSDRVWRIFGVGDIDAGEEDAQFLVALVNWFDANADALSAAQARAEAAEGEEREMKGACLTALGSREPSPDGLGPSGFDPSRKYGAETAPRDGQWIVLHYEDDKIWPCMGRWNPATVDFGPGQLLTYEWEVWQEGDWNNWPDARLDYWQPLPPLASAIEARRAETQSGSVEDESAPGRPNDTGGDHLNRERER